MEISTERPLVQHFNELKSKDAQEYHTEFINLADYHTLIAVRCLEILIVDCKMKLEGRKVGKYRIPSDEVVYAKAGWIGHLAEAIPRQNLLNLLDSYIHNGWNLEDDESDDSELEDDPEEVHKVLIKWLEQLDSSPMSAESARSRTLIAALCNIIHPGSIAIENGSLGSESDADSESGEDIFFECEDGGCCDYIHPGSIENGSSGSESDADSDSGEDIV
ncbi:hypothetical protein C8R42DRAFT_781318 [Lentinula raphanica]|nr:hypothetical protein C8R42DRAFT_781318 [Lentinula raphanica]